MMCTKCGLPMAKDEECVTGVSQKKRRLRVFPGKKTEYVMCIPCATKNLVRVFEMIGIPSDNPLVNALKTYEKGTRK